MELISFRVQNFRSIVDSGWIDFSRDGVTVLVGQNESGKTSILQALACTLGGVDITPDDRRIDSSDPKFQIRIKITSQELIKSGRLGDFNDDIGLQFLDKYLVSKQGIVQLEFWQTVHPTSNSSTELNFILSDASEFDKALNELRSQFVDAQPSKQGTPVPITPNTPTPTTPPTLKSSTPATPSQSEEEEEDEEQVDSETVVTAINEALPYAVLFNAESGLLPNSVDLDEKNKPSGPGSVAANNYLTIAEIDLPRLAEGDGRYRQNILNKANQRVSDDFAKFWSQVIGSKSRLSLKCSFEYYPATVGTKAGKPFLEFWIADGSTQLYPKQRSQGVRWFVSFYLQLRATEKRRSSRLFLLDEPGANLHDKAQEDVLRLIDQLRKEIPIIYSTHSPKMIEYEKIFRIRAIQRDSQHEDSPTVVIDAQHLGTASSDTLSPLLGAMGSDMAQQSVIKKKRNVLLEEISGYYYLKAFWSLQKRKEEAHFIAATGVNKIPLLANMFLGWGIEFVVAVDDDKQGREVFNQLKKDLCGDDSEKAKNLLLKLPECTSIEEAFSTADFKKFVLKDENAQVESGNSEYLKLAHISKPVTALTFMLSVSDGSITAENLDKETNTNIKKIVDAIVDLLKLHDTSQKE